MRDPVALEFDLPTGKRGDRDEHVARLLRQIDRFNRVTFDAVETKALRIEVQLQPEWSAGILEWRVEDTLPKSGK